MTVNGFFHPRHLADQLLDMRSIPTIPYSHLHTHTHAQKPMLRGMWIIPLLGMRMNALVAQLMHKRGEKGVAEVIAHYIRILNSTYLICLAQIVEKE